MASFTDTPQVYLSQYTPKVDLGLYANTLDLKQNQYNQGVQRIQGSIDQVAGLDIMHPLAKSYLHDKLTNLGSQLNTMAGGDFSNQSLVSQAMSLAPKVAKDEKIQTAVISTQQIRSLSASQKRLYEKNPELYPSSMRYLDNKAVNDYLSTTDLDQGYHGTTEASRYTDYHKQVEDLVKQIVPDVKLEINPDGRYQWKTEKYSTVTNDRIQGVISGYFSTSPEASRSMNADASYTYRDASTEFMRSHMSDVYNRNISSLEAINKQYERDVKNNPADRDFIADRRAAMAANEKSIQEMRSKKSLYNNYLEDPSKLEQVKQTIYQDNLKGMFSTIFQKDDIDRKIEENFNAVNADKIGLERANLNIRQAEFGLNQWDKKMEAIHNGFEPYVDKYGNPIKLTPESSNWSVYQDFLTKGKKGKTASDGSSTNGDSPLSDTPHPVGKINPEGEFTSELMHSQVKEMAGEIHNEKGTGIQDQYFKKWRVTYGSAYADDKDARAAFDDFVKVQSNLFLEGGATDPAYREYREKIMPIQRKIDAYSQMEDKALEYATKLNPMQIKPFTVTYKDESGKNMNVEIDMKKHSQFAQMFNDYSNMIAANPSKGATISPGFGGGWSSGGGLSQADILSSFKGKPGYNILKSIVSDRNAYQQVLDQLLVPQSKILQNRTTSKEDYLKANGKDFAPQQYDFEGKKEQLDAAKRRIFSLLSENRGIGDLGGSSYDLTKYSVDDIEPVGAYVNAAGKTVYNFKLGKNKADYVTSTQPQGDNLITIDPDAELKRLIAVTKITPTKGDGVMTTKDGKVRFAIGEGTYGNGTYDAYIIDKGVPVPIRMVTPEGDIFHGASPSQIMKSLEDLSRQPSRVDPKKPMSRNEVYDKLTLTMDQYEAKYPKPATSK